MKRLCLRYFIPIYVLSQFLVPVRCPSAVAQDISLPDDGKVQVILMKGKAGDKEVTQLDIGYEISLKIIKCEECHATHGGSGVVKIIPTAEEWAVFVRIQWTKAHDDERAQRILSVEGPQWRSNGYPKYWVVYTHGPQGSLLFHSSPN